MSESERFSRIKNFLYTFPNVRGISILPDMVQVKLQHGTQSPGVAYLEGMKVEYIYEEPSPFGSVPL